MSRPYFRQTSSMPNIQSPSPSTTSNSPLSISHARISMDTETGSNTNGSTRSRSNSRSSSDQTEPTTASTLLNSPNDYFGSRDSAKRRTPSLMKCLLNRFANLWRRSPGEQDTPYLTMLLLRLTSSHPSLHLLRHPRTLAFLGALAICLPAIGCAVIEKVIVSDDLDFHFPFFSLILIHLGASLVLEISSGRWMLFERAGVVRTARMVPLALVYVLALVAAHYGRAWDSVHGTFSVVQALMPLAVVSGAVAGAVLGRKSTRGLDQFGATSLAAALSWPHAALERLTNNVSGSDASSNNSSSTSSSGWLTPENRLEEDEFPATASGYASGMSSSSSSLSTAIGHPLGSNRLSNKAAETNNAFGRWLALPACISAALAIWSPAFSMVAYTNIISSGGNHWLRLLIGLLLALATLVLSAGFFLAVDQHLAQHPTLSAASFMRHFAPMVTVMLLILWPLVERPLDVLDAASPKALGISVAVAMLGALTLMAKVMMVRVGVSDGVVGVAMIGLIKPVVCLAVGWWIYGYRYSSLQLAGFVLATACLTAWSLLRLFRASCAPLVVVPLRTAVGARRRPRKYSANII
ncbi:hypothetical protein LPJ66_000293 [Kickxella alabastrina]|uniref:Uncharacterized protein n=1 Tax=Kickxella alabastrina TaxID=61397 RepID=A0ACC1IWN0_9FUNG|nr:hypothetical protein LPJ66_000293 [Kickxella alabastrina]